MHVLLSLLTLVTISLGASADTRIDFTLHGDSPQTRRIPVYIQQGRLLAKGIDGDQGDVLFNRNNDTLALIDHRAHRYRLIDSVSIERMVLQGQEILPLLQGVQQQLSQLPPEQRAKVEQLLGNLPLTQAPSAPAAIPTVLQNAGVRTIRGYVCEYIEMLRAGQNIGSICLVHNDSLRLPADDYATLRALQHFGEQLADKAGPLASRFGISIPPLHNPALQGIPVEYNDSVQGYHAELMVISNHSLEQEALSIPSGYGLDDGV